MDFSFPCQTSETINAKHYHREIRGSHSGFKVSSIMGYDIVSIGKKFLRFRAGILLPSSGYEYFKNPT